MYLFSDSFIYKNRYLFFLFQTGTLIALGMLLFCGSCYFHALTGYKPIRQVTPYGGMLLMIGWLTMVF